MKIKEYNTEQKHFFIKSYPELKNLEKAVKIIKKNNATDIQLSILGKFTKEQTSNNKVEQEFLENKLKDYWRDMLETSAEFGFFKNPEIGSVFIIGSLTSMFLHKIDGKELGAMSTGLYGILRGLGAYQLQVETYLKALSNGSYLLVLRGLDDELSALEEVLNKTMI